MKGVPLSILLVLASMTAQACHAGDRLQLIPVAQSDSGLVYWHGHALYPPFRFDVGFITTTNRDTSWAGVFVNGWRIGPVHRSPVLPPAIDSLFARRREIAHEVAEATKAEETRAPRTAPEPSESRRIIELIPGRLIRLSSSTRRGSPFIGKETPSRSRWNSVVLLSLLCQEHC